jgi:hypothetical protein
MSNNNFKIESFSTSNALVPNIEVDVIEGPQGPQGFTGPSGSGSESSLAYYSLTNTTPTTYTYDAGVIAPFTGASVIQAINSFTSTSNSTLIVPYNGDYLVNYNISFSDTNNNTILTDIAVIKNDGLYTKSCTTSTSTTVGKSYNSSASGILSLLASDILCVCSYNISGITQTVDVSYFNLNATMLYENTV